MPRGKRRQLKPAPHPSRYPHAEPTPTLPEPQGETLQDLIARAEKIKRTSEALVRQMRQLAAEFEAKRRREET
jgi:hypothetical protein